MLAEEEEEEEGDWAPEIISISLIIARRDGGRSSCPASYSAHTESRLNRRDWNALCPRHVYVVCCAV